MASCCDDQAASLPPHKRGDSFVLACTYRQDGVAASVALYTIRAQLRDSSSQLVQELSVSKANQTTSPGVFSIAGGATGAWPLDILRCDIQFTEGDTVRSTQTFSVEVIEGITS